MLVSGFPAVEKSIEHDLSMFLDSTSSTGVVKGQTPRQVGQVSTLVKIPGNLTDLLASSFSNDQ